MPSTVTQTLPVSLVETAFLPPVRVEPEGEGVKDGLEKSVESYEYEAERE